MDNAVISAIKDNPIISVIVAAIIAGLIAGVKDTASQVVKDTYTGLKGFLQCRFRGKPKDKEVEALSQQLIQEYKPASDTYNITGKNQQGFVFNPKGHVTVTINNPPADKPSIACWVGRPATIAGGLVGRDTHLTDLTHAFKNRRAVVLSGTPGCGKSRLAAEYTHQLTSDGFWTSAGSNLAQTLVALAPHLGVEPKGRSDDEIATEVKRQLSILPADTLWVIDNLIDLVWVNALLNATPTIHLLITTRDGRSHLLPNTVAFHEIKALVPSAAVLLLCSRGSDRNDLALPEMAKQVGYLPLALEMLAVRLGAPFQTPAKLLDQLCKALTPIQLRIFQDTVGATIERPDGVFAAIAGTLADLPQKVRERLSPLGYVADAPIPYPLLYALIEAGEEEMEELLEACQRQSVISLGDKEVGTVVVHALTVAAIATTNRDFRGLLEVALTRTMSRLRSICLDHPMEMRAEMAHYQQIYSQASKGFGVDDASVLSFSHSMAVGYRVVGLYKEGIRLDKETLKARERVLGTNHPDTLSSRNNLAIGYCAVGRYEEAISLDEETLETKERVLGTDHPDTLSSRDGLASDYRAVGRYEEAIRLDKETLKTRERVLGTDHPNTLNSRSNLASDYYAVGRYEEAIRLGEETLKARERVLGTDHPDTLMSRKSLALGYRAVGRESDAKALEGKGE